MESFTTYNIINFADVTMKENDEVSWDVKRSFIPMKLYWHSTSFPVQITVP
jgi:hypothetical protein